MQAIATNIYIQNKLRGIRHTLVPNHFNPDTLDLFKIHNKLTTDGVVTYDGQEGYSRLVDDARSQSFLVSWINKARRENPSLRIRHLTTLPENYLDYDSLRDTFLNLQRRANLPEQFVFTEKSETAQAIIAYINSLEVKDSVILVVDVEMKLAEFDNLVKWGIDNLKEVCLIYRDWTKEIDKYISLMTLSLEERGRVHVARMPLSMNNYQKEELIATALVCLGFKSVSFFEPEPHPAVIAKIAHRPRKTEQQKLDAGRWVDAEIMSYVPQHPRRCTCLGNNHVPNVGTKECIIYHDVEDLSKEYSKAIIDKKHQGKILQLDTMQPILRKLRIVQ